MPSDLLSAVGDRIVGTIARPAHEPRSRDPGAAAQRSRGRARPGRSALPTARSFGIGGEVGLSPVPGGRRARPVARLRRDRSSRRRRRASRARRRTARRRRSTAISSTAWVTPFSDVTQSVNVKLPDPITLDHLDLQLVADGRHSVPTKLEVRSNTGAAPGRRGVPPVADQSTPDSTVRGAGRISNRSRGPSSR